MAGLRKNRLPIPGPGGQDAMQASTIYYQDYYAELEPPATSYVTSDAPLASVDNVPSLPTTESNASLVAREPRMTGLRFLGGVLTRIMQVPQQYLSPYSSKFQPEFVGYHPNVQFNDKWYIAYPAATVMLGGKHNLALSERVPQVVTRSTGGPGGIGVHMRPMPRFSRVQNVPRYSTMPKSYPTQSSPG